MPYAYGAFMYRPTGFAFENPFYTTPKGTSQYVTEQEYAGHRAGGTIPRAIEREGVIEKHTTLPEGYSIVQSDRAFHVYFQGQDTGKYGLDYRKACEIISRMQGGKVTKRAAKYTDVAKPNASGYSKKEAAGFKLPPHTPLDEDDVETAVALAIDLQKIYKPALVANQVFHSEHDQARAKYKKVMAQVGREAAQAKIEARQDTKDPRLAAIRFRLEQAADMAAIDHPLTGGAPMYVGRPEVMEAYAQLLAESRQSLQNPRSRRARRNCW